MSLSKGFPQGQATGATAASLATADSCENANMPGFGGIGEKGGWMNHGPTFLERVLGVRYVGVRSGGFALKILV